MTENLKVLLIDIETSPNLGYCWGKYEQDIITFEREWNIISVSYKWLGEKETKVFALPDFELYKTDKTSDKEIVRKIWDILDQAHIVVGQNLDKFDIRKINSRFIVNGLTPPSPYKTVDTLKIAKKYFGFNSNKLNDLGTYLGVGNKVNTGGFQLWLDCAAGKADAWKKMKAYNKQDVVLLEKVYLKMRPWLATHPNIGVLKPGFNCHTCGSDKVQRRGYSFSKATKYQRFHCSSCGSWSQGKMEKV